MITYNRAAYTELSLKALLDSCDEHMRVWVWHNGTDAATRAVVQKYSRHPRFHHLHVSDENKKLREPTNWFWSSSNARYLTKVDDDCILETGWGARLRQAHEDNPELGMVGCWRFPDEDFVPELANKKIVDIAGGHQLMRNCWVQGSGYVMKREVVDQLGLLREGESFPAYGIRAAVAGWKNGWYYPFVREEHMDDPRCPYCLAQKEDTFGATAPLTALSNGVTNTAEWIAHERYMARTVQAADPDPRAWIGWRRIWHNLQFRARKWLSAEEWRRDIRPAH